MEPTALSTLIGRAPVPLPWAEGEKIPWDDPAFSQRMLREHLSQQHDAASRRSVIIDQHVDWLHGIVLAEQPARILDLGCGPGLYANRLARLGHACVGIDFSPASIAYAIETAHADNLACRFVQQDIRKAEFGHDFDLAMLIFGELNVFRRSDVTTLLQRVYLALKPTGQIVLEAHTYEAVQAVGERPPTWYAVASGLFADRPHLCLTENFWDAPQQACTERYYIVDAQTAQVTQHAASMQAYRNADYAALLTACGFVDLVFYPAFGAVDPPDADFVVIVARKP